GGTDYSCAGRQELLRDEGAKAALGAGYEDHCVFHGYSRDCDAIQLRQEVRAAAAEKVSGRLARNGPVESALRNLMRLRLAAGISWNIPHCQRPFSARDFRVAYGGGVRAVDANRKGSCNRYVRSVQKA